MQQSMTTQMNDGRLSNEQRNEEFLLLVEGCCSGCNCNTSTTTPERI